jgi:hypothetical protein
MHAGCLDAIRWLLQGTINRTTSNPARSSPLHYGYKSYSLMPFTLGCF